MARPHACAACGRRFVVVGRPSHESVRCVCGAALAETSLSSGVYEIRKSRRASRRRTARRAVGASPSPPKPSSMPHESDLGYGESHGYGPAHGGPTGPGDAPATEAPGEELPRSSADPSAPRS